MSTVPIDKTFDTKEEAAKWRADYMRDYHPAGYGTFIEIKETDDGKWRAYGGRYSSCD